MFGFDPHVFLAGLVFEQEMKRIDREHYDLTMWRGPMIEADIDWRVAPDYRPMIAEDIGYLSESSDRSTNENAPKR